MYSDLRAAELAADRAAGLALGNSTPNLFEQRIFHDDPSSSATFSQRWYVDWSSYTPSGPIFLYIGGEGPNGGTPGGFVAVQAAALSAVIVTLEHRWCA